MSSSLTYRVSRCFKSPTGLEVGTGGTGPGTVVMGPETGCAHKNGKGNG